MRLVSVMSKLAYDMPGTHPDAIDGADLAQIGDVSEGASVIFLCLNAHNVDWYQKFPPVADCRTALPNDYLACSGRSRCDAFKAT